MKPPLLIITALLLDCVVSSGANDNHPVGARASALANATVMHAGIWSVHHNQAGLGIYNRMAIGFHHENMFVVPEYNLHSLAFTLPAAGGVFGLNYTYFGYRLYNESKIGIGFGKKLNEVFSAGIQLNYFNTYIADETGNTGTIAVEGGLIAKPAEDFFIGVHIFNPTGARLSNIHENEQIPTIMRGGLSYMFFEKLILSVETEKDLENPAVFRSGIEYRIIENLYLRTGVSTNPVRNTFGIGINIRRVSADVAFTHHQILGFTPHFSFQLAFQ